jgi:lipopolysaccharide cholinephosphotransferase
MARKDKLRPMLSEDLRKLQMIQLEMLIEVDRICRKCNIKYNIIAGTLLGSVRHKGYIPWDDDADVAFLRPEYEKFREACKTELDTSRFYFQDHRNTEGYRWGYGKLRRKGTEFVREGQEHMPYPSGVFIDLFPLDNVPDNRFIRWFHNIHCNIIRKFLWSEVGKVADANPVIRVLYRLMALVPSSIIFSHFQRFTDKWNNKNTEMVRILTFPTPNKFHGYYRRWYEESDDYTFEGHIFKGIKRFDEYLTFKYGDYMKLPPEDQRKTHPAASYKLL